MAEFKLERFRYNWKGSWTSGTSYNRDDVIQLNGKSYVCLVTHTASSSFRTDLNAILPGSNPPQSQPKWITMTSGKSFVGEYQLSTDYNLGDIVLYNGTLWLCVVPHNSSNFATEVANWQLFSDSISFEGTWETATAYGQGSVVKYNGITYRAINSHQSGGTLEDNIDDWEIYNSGIEYRGDWTSSTVYRKNDLVKYGATIFRCNTTHTSNGTNLNDNFFDVEFFGSQFDGEWSSESYYNIGDIVRHRGFIYYAIRNNNNSSPYQDSNNADWILLSRSTHFEGDWSVSSEYKTGDVVLRGGNLYLALQDIGASTKDGSSTDYLDDTLWELLIPGKTFKGSWTPGTTYSVGDVIYYLGSSYTCNFEHDASYVNAPLDNGSGYEYWDLLIFSQQQGGLRDKGDILTYGLSREIDNDGSTIFDGSTLGNVRVPIGQEEQLLSVSSDLEAYWRDITVDADAVYVSTNGVDGLDRGTFEKPFRTIRYACEYVEDTFPAGTPVIVRVSTGKFEEIGPIIVPAGCAVNGDELRSTTIIASPPIAEYENDLDYVREYITHFESIVFNIITGVGITPSIGNTVNQVTTANFVPGNGLEQFPISNLIGASAIVSLNKDFIDYASFVIESGDINPVMIGTNTITGLLPRINAALALEYNKQFLIEELYRFLIAANPTISFTESRVKSDIESLLRGITKDLRYPGNYGTLTAARRYVNATLGSQGDDLFWLRDSTGLRDCTTAGLQGVLRPPQVFELYQRPTGGACVALDPGWGPDDERVWITNRSPYIQGVTNTGSGCIGKKVDGTLHNGGNKSMVSNDFTQVLSDGIGIWVTDNARVELVSVFTYYCQIGYFAENGGVIRATNGNNSYGKYGAIADGADDTETPQTVSVFNRNNEAQITSTFSGGNTDQIFLFEYANAGEEYSTATANIIGSGSGADVEYTDFRDSAIFEARLTKQLGDSGSNGGSGYLTRQGSAQETLGAASSIKLSANDPTLDISEILGMRLIITDGTGVGQYGIVDTFNFVTKSVEVIRESDDQPGWDHIIPGTPIATNLDLTTRYRIEPRIIVSSPGFASLNNYNLFANRTYVGLEYENTRETFTNVTTASEIAFVDDNDDSVTINSVISSIAIQVNGVFAVNPSVPFVIRGDTSGTTATVTAVTANTGSIKEFNISGNGNSFVGGESLTIVLAAGTGDTFDDDPIPATFDVVRVGETYTLTVNNSGAGYSVGDTLTISGTLVGGVAEVNDIIITVTDVSDDSTSSIQDFTYTGTGVGKSFVALTNAEYAQYSRNGQTWTEVPLSFVGDFKALISSDTGRFIAVANNTNRISYSLTGASWTTGTLPLTASWRDGTYGAGKYVLVADDINKVLVSSNGTSWTLVDIPDDIGGDTSTISQWAHVTYGKGIYLAVSANDYATATSTDGGVTWTRNDEVLPAIPDIESESGPVAAPDWDVVDLTYGDNRFVILDSLGRSAYSFDGVTWYQGNNVPGGLAFTTLNYSNGIFIALGTQAGSSTNSCATSEDGIYWTSRSLDVSLRWSQAAYANLNDVGTWVLMANAAQTNAVEHIRTGRTAKLRSEVLSGSFQSIRIWDPGSGYTTTPTLTVVDPNEESNIAPSLRLGNRVLSQPDFINRGNGYRSTTTAVTITGDGYADIIPEDNILVLSGVSVLPGPGVQIRISGVLDLETEDDLTDLKVFSGVSITDLGDDGSGNGTRLVSFLISPGLRTEYNVTHGSTVTLRERYSQCRISGHDFLDIGTGNFENTNYPQIYASGNYFVALPENEVLESNGGRVYYTSTDQDGNFRTGELFAVQQSTGIVTISAEFFELDGLNELALGGVRLGGSGTVISEFSTDPTFTADSNNIIPTQRAIATFLANRLSVGGENLEVNRLVAGRIGVGGVDNSIQNVTNQYISVPVDVTINGIYVDDDEVERPVGIQGTIISQMLFLKTFDEDMQ